MYDDGVYQWDEEKAALNKSKHDDSFAEAGAIFNAPLGVEGFDEAHSEEELRYFRIGLSGRRLLYVVFTERENRIRIIHARKANKEMVRFYEEENQ